MKRMSSYFISEIEAGRLVDDDVLEHLADSSLEDQTTVSRAAVNKHHFQCQFVRIFCESK